MKNIITKDIKVYSSTEWLYNDQKDYQKVFLRNEVAYIYVEVKILNLKGYVFTRQTNLVIQFYKNEENKLVKCGKVDMMKPYKKEGYYTFREGWGNQVKGAYWKEGDYIAIAYLDNRKIGEAEFSIAPPWQELELNPFFEMDSINVFESDYNISERNYHEAFKAKDIRYLYVELFVKEKRYGNWDDWKGEFKLVYFTKTGNVKGVVSRVVSKDTLIKNGFSVGWGAQELGCWRSGTIEYKLSFMNRLIYQGKIELI